MEFRFFDCPEGFPIRSSDTGAFKNMVALEWQVKICRSVIRLTKSIDIVSDFSMASRPDSLIPKRMLLNGNMRSQAPPKYRNLSISVGTRVAYTPTCTSIKSSTPYPKLQNTRMQQIRSQSPRSHLQVMPINLGEHRNPRHIYIYIANKSSNPQSARLAQLAEHKLPTPLVVHRSNR